MTAARPLALGLIGAGRWGRNYIATLAAMRGVFLARLASRNPESTTLAGPGCAVTADWREVIEAGKLDGVIVATPPALHAEMTRAAVAAGLPVLVEKPLTLDWAEARALAEVVQSRSGLVMVDHTHLFHPAFRALKEHVPDIAPVMAIRARAGAWGPFRDHTPVLWDWGSHDVAMCLDLMGRRPTTASAGHLESLSLPEGLGEILRLRLGFGDVAVEIEVGNILAARVRRFEVVGAEGALVYDDTAADKLIRREPSGQSRAIASDTTPPLTCAVAAFAAAIRSGSRDSASLRLGVDVVAVLAECARSLSPPPSPPVGGRGSG